jgi:hypothetical protein
MTALTESGIDPAVRALEPKLTYHRISQSCGNKNMVHIVFIILCRAKTTILFVLVVRKN